MLSERPVEVILEAVDRFGSDRLALAASWQKETAVLVDLVRRHAPEARIFTLDTGALFEETYATWRKVEERYGITVEVHQGPSLGRQASTHGDRLWERNPDACCDLRKVQPLQRALADVDAWVSGVRREQGPSRAGTPKLAWDAKHERWKANPLADWTEQDVWRYIVDHDLPYNQLHDRGYASIGCTHRTRPGTNRDGRWAGTGKVECGLHA